jgi:DNA repair ATPase RecN
VTGLLKLPTSGCSDGPESVDAVSKAMPTVAVEHRVLRVAHLPSVICVALPDASE